MGMRDIDVTATAMLQRSLPVARPKLYRGPEMHLYLSCLRRGQKQNRKRWEKNADAPSVCSPRTHVYPGLLARGRAGYGHPDRVTAPVATRHSCWAAGPTRLMCGDVH